MLHYRVELVDISKRRVCESPRVSTRRVRRRRVKEIDERKNVKKNFFAFEKVKIYIYISYCLSPWLHSLS